MNLPYRYRGLGLVGLLALLQPMVAVAGGREGNGVKGGGVKGDHGQQHHHHDHRCAWQGLDEAVHAGGSCGGDDFFLRQIVLRVSYVVPDAAFKEPGILEHHAKAIP